MAALLYDVLFVAFVHVWEVAAHCNQSGVCLSESVPQLSGTLSLFKKRASYGRVLQKHCRPCEPLMGIMFLKTQVCHWYKCFRSGQELLQDEPCMRDLHLLWMLKQLQRWSRWCMPTSGSPQMTLWMKWVSLVDQHSQFWQKNERRDGMASCIMTMPQVTRLWQCSNSSWKNKFHSCYIYIHSEIHNVAALTVY